MKNRDKLGGRGTKGGRVGEQRREGRRDVKEPKGRENLGGRAPNGLEPAGSIPWQPQWN